MRPSIIVGFTWVMTVMAMLFSVALGGRNTEQLAKAFAFYGASVAVAALVQVRLPRSDFWATILALAIDVTLLSLLWP